MPEALSLREARERFAEITGRVRAAGERVVLREDRKDVAALVSPSDLKALEAIEERLDLLDALDALADYRANGGVPFHRIRADLGL